MRAVPNMVVLSPADCGEVAKAVIASANYHGPVYIRLTGTLNQPIIYKEDYDFEIGKAVTLREGTDVTFIAAGTMVYESLKAAELLEKEGVSSSVVNMHTIKPLDFSVIDRGVKETRLIVTVEEHSVIGGLGGAVAEYKAELSTEVPLLRVGIPDVFGKVGCYSYMLQQYGLKSEAIAVKVRERMEKLT